MPFTHLHVHSAFSLLEGVPPPGALAARAAQFRMPALALTDHQSLAGAVPFYQACQAAGVQPILGLELDTTDGDQLVLLARDRTGYRSLCRLASAVGLLPRPDGSKPACPPEILRAETAGLIALSGGPRSLLPRLVSAGRLHRASRLIGTYSALFGPDQFFVELVIHDEADAATVDELARLAEELGVPAVATNDTLGLLPEDHATATLLGAIRTRTTLAAPHPAKTAHPERYLKAPAQMERLFAAYPQALANTRFIARRCDLTLPLGGPRFPGITLKTGDTAFSQLYKFAFAGATRLYRPLTAAVTARLQQELEVISELGFAPYFLIVCELVRWCRRQDIPVLGRGSAADSLVAYVLGITAVDPLAHGLYFERFLNADRAEPPDIDLDLCWRRRDEVLTYVYETYGHEQVALIGTHVTFRLRGAWRDVARAHGRTDDEVRALVNRPAGYSRPEAEAEGPPALNGAGDEDPSDDDAMETPADPGWGLLYPPLAEAGLAEDDGESLPPLDATLLAAGAALEGHPRHFGIHCGGIVVAPFPLTNEVPLVRAANGRAITQYEMDAIAALGLVKIDLLGSRALSAMNAAAARVRLHGTPLELDRIPFDDPATFELLRAGATLGCFQLESPGVRALLRALQPRAFEAVIAALALFRPGPLQGGLKDQFIARLREGRPPPPLHPRLAGVLAETHGVILYQEQFLQLVHEVAGFSLGEAERLRSLLNHRPPPETVAELRAGFVAGAIANDLPQAVGEQIWEVLCAFVGFGFCKGHAASYAVVAYRMAYCKAHHPAEFLAAVLDNQAGFYPAQVYIEEARRLRIQVLGPDINRSAAGTTARERALRLGLQAVRGLRRDSVQAILTARRAGGTFVSLRDLLTRVPLSAAEIATLIEVGALDRESQDRSRPELLWQARLWRPRLERERARGSGPQAALPLLEALPDLPPDMPALRPYSRSEILGLEQRGLGVTVLANPLEPYMPLLARYGALPADTLEAHGGESVVVGGLPVAVRRHGLAGGGWMLFLTLQDAAGLVEVVVPGPGYAAAVAALAHGGPLLVRGLVEVAPQGGAVVRAIKVRALMGAADRAREAPSAPTAPAASAVLAASSEPAAPPNPQPAPVAVPAAGEG
ncbi:MAG TPA: DNA polymerase III subunit alpha [Chloroflexia bacterium]|nr:DNA polymerase III subunit alpha [Chloroflexia bacterium]